MHIFAIHHFCDIPHHADETKSALTAQTFFCPNTAVKYVDVEKKMTLPWTIKQAQRL